ncbi:hypothetical protein HY090_01360 [Candidatus Kaiserbacteria bacterium]|nr:hypothetical protein [Candidatus Kaiserbacteria bacterium]
MSWFSEIRVRQSEKNGTITATRRLGVWSVVVDGCVQTGPETRWMWRDGFEKLRHYLFGRKIRTILILGLGAGGEIRDLHRLFPGCRITAVEYDETMVSLAKELNLNHLHPFPDVICADARDAVPGLSGAYDLIVLDLFRGSEPSPLATDPAFLAALDTKLGNEGLIIANTFARLEYLDSLGTYFTLISRWKFGKNNLGIFRKKTPEDSGGYIPLHAWPEFDPMPSIPAFLKPGHVGENPEGTYWRFWPFSFEEYRTDAEPMIEPLPKELRTPLRIIMWQRFFRTDTPEGWTTFSDKPSLVMGFTKLDPEYTKRWSKTLRQNLRDWNARYLGKEYVVEPVSFVEFKEAYTKSTLPLMVRYETPKEIEARMQGPAHVSFFAARRIDDKSITGGIAVMYSSSRPLSYYLAGFHTKKAGNAPVVVGLLDHWFQESLKEQIEFLDFGNFWQQGDPSAWKGFSAFKAKLGPTHFFYKPKLYRFLFGNTKAER